ncbi:Lung seven transmembrane receptor family protein isoform 2 [Hibiscus syriacus]|uniref:Lung seven transmembrane receptor family protein isoform 2 n=1 Tax=Hibiscus syriacus TaxID=106335 RepID=A0A6A2WE21_HIBSY|nr:Lung seven transmembrane receptor family protein isoform 2 [Hibiscus syriacus]
MPKLRNTLFLLCLLWFCFVSITEASVHGYNGEKFVSKGNAFVVHGGSEGIYSSFADPYNVIAIGGDSYIRFEKIAFHRPKESANFNSHSVQAIVFEVEDRETVGGSAYGGQRAVCCTADLSKLGMMRLQHVMVGEEERRGSIEEERRGSRSNWEMGIEVEGKTVWKNPTGYLPGRMAPLMNFYGFMSLAFVILGIFWFLQYARFWREVLPLQNCITLVIMLGMLEMALWYFDYAEFNESGIRPVGITMWAVTFNTIKHTIARIIILIVSMGYGVVRPTLGGLTSKVIMLGATFFLASEVLELVENVGAVSDISGKARLFFVLPVAILDAFFILWIFTSLSSTLNKLRARRMVVKLDIYRKFANALAVMVIVSVGWVCYELYFKSNDIYNEQWQNAWIIPAFWQILSFSLLCHLCSLGTFSEFYTLLTIRCLVVSILIAPSKDFRSAPEARTIQGSNETSSNGDLEDKTE